jgi:HSP20 family protein
MTTATTKPETTQPAEVRRTTAYLTPAVNIREWKDEYVLEAEMPGINKSGLEITVENNELMIFGRRTEPEMKADVVYRESRPLDYRRVFDLDPSIDTSKITAKLENGILTVHLPKTEEVKPRKVAVTE